MTPLAVLLDVTPLGCDPTAKTGLARVAESLAAALATRPGLAISTSAFGSVVATAKYAGQRAAYAALNPIRFSPSLLETAYLRLVPDSHRLGQLVNLVRNPLRGVDPTSFQVVHSTYARFPRVVRRLAAARVITVHDLIGLRLPADHVAKGQAAITRRILKSIGPADFVACVSEHTRNDFLEETRHSETRTVTIPNGVDHGRFRPVDSPEAWNDVARRFDLVDRPFLLTLSSLAPHKNLPFLLAAWRQVKPHHPEPRLVVAGGKTHSQASLRASLGVDPADQSVVATGFLSDDHFAALASRCHAFLFPSVYEGFGLPPLEAMACGGPVIASDTSSLPEVVGDAGTLLAPDDLSGWIEAMRQAVANAPSQAAREAAIVRSRRFTWEAAAEAYERLYRTAVAGKETA